VCDILCLLLCRNRCILDNGYWVKVVNTTTFIVIKWLNGNNADRVNTLSLKVFGWFVYTTLVRFSHLSLIRAHGNEKLRLEFFFSFRIQQEILKYDTTSVFHVSRYIRNENKRGPRYCSFSIFILSNRAANGECRKRTTT